MENTPKLLYFTRQMAAHLGAAKVGLEALAGGSAIGTAVGSVMTHVAGGKVDWLVPLIGSLLSGASLLVRTLVAYYLNISVIKDPLPQPKPDSVTTP